MKKKLDKVLTSTLVLLMSVMVLSTLLQVFARVINLNVPFTEELTVYAMMWVTMFGAAYTFGLKKHIAIDVLISSISEDKKWKLEILVESIVILFAVLVLIVGGTRFVYITFRLGQISSVMLIPKGWIYLVLPLSGIVTVIYNVINIRESIKRKEA